MCSGLLAFHCLTGCDTTRYLSGKGGKGEALKYYLKEHRNFENIKCLGNSTELTEEVEISAAKFSVALYNKQIPIEDADLNAL